MNYLAKSETKYGINLILDVFFVLFRSRKILNVFNVILLCDFVDGVQTKRVQTINEKRTEIE